ncbi:MAG: sortase [Clostridium sp.]|nr:MAG: sortase [Clostridium sp.]
MENKTRKKYISTVISVLVLFIGICILGSTYFNTKKHEVFDEMNELYYEQIASEIEDLDEIDDEEISVIEDETEKASGSYRTRKMYQQLLKKPVVSIDYTKYYVGNISIPKIDLKRGFVSKDSKYNNVNRNIYIVPESDYPDKEGGNFILASHSGTSSISYFRNLYKLTLGDKVDITYNNKKIILTS